MEREIKEMMKLANDSLKASEEIVKFCQDKGYSVEVMTSAIESIYLLIQKKKENEK